MPLRRLLRLFQSSAPTRPNESRADDARRLTEAQVRQGVIEHLQWCARFNELLAGTPEDSVLPPADGKPAPAPLPDAQHSGLGHWISDMQVHLGKDHPGLLQLEKEQRNFHQLAHEALGLIRERRIEQASLLLNNDFERSRVRVVELLRSLAPTVATPPPR